MCAGVGGCGLRVVCVQVWVGVDCELCVQVWVGVDCELCVQAG